MKGESRRRRRCFWLPWLALLLALGSCVSGGRGGAPAAGERGESGRRDFSRCVLDAVKTMPSGGGYAADRQAEVRLAERGVRWQGGRLWVAPAGASPTFCSAACYMALLRALHSWESEQAAGARFSPRVWHSLRVEAEHPDGYLSWGRVNANGPGLAKWVHDLGAGVSFSDARAARPGDFLKFFHTPAIGAQEKGHMVVFLGLEENAGQLCLRYWSSNKRGGYGVRSTPLAGVHHPIFTRITHPERIAAAAELPARDEWLAAMLRRPCSYAEAAAKCAVSAR